MALTKKKLKELRSLSLKKIREAKEMFIVEGVRLTQEALGSGFEILEAYYTTDLLEQPGGKSLVQNLLKTAWHAEQVAPRELTAIADTVTSQGIVAVLRQKKTQPELVLRREGGESIVVAFDAVADPGNLGSMIRTCDWFGVHGILVGDRSVELWNPKVLRATMGGIFHLPVAIDVDLPWALSRAREMGYTVYVTDQHGESHFDRLRYSRKSLLIFGNEAWGVSDQVKNLADVRVAIRRYGAAESLNVGVACGVVLSALHRLYDE